MNLVSLVWFLLFCPFLFVFLLQLGNSCDHDCCPFCDEKKGEDQTKCKSCGFEFLEKSGNGFSLAFSRRGFVVCPFSSAVDRESKVSLGTYYLPRRCSYIRTS